MQSAGTAWKTSYDAESVDRVSLNVLVGSLLSLSLRSIELWLVHRVTNRNTETPSRKKQVTKQPVTKTIFAQSQFSFERSRQLIDGVYDASRSEVRTLGSGVPE